MAQEDFNTTKSFLSPSVHKMLVEIGKDTNDLVQEHDSYLTEEQFVINWSKISFLIEDLKGDNYSIHKESPEAINRTIKRLWPVFIEANKKSEKLTPADLEKLRSLLRWTRKESEIIECLLNYRSRTVGNIEAILLLTSILERSLGNVFLLKGQNVPFLLRDLLSTEELKSILGQGPILFLQLLIGTPVALNLRNVVWHGFPNPNEIRTEFAATLFVTTASVGWLLAHQQICLQMLPYRHQISSFHHYTELLKDNLPDINEFASEVRSLFSDSELIAPSHRIFWEMLLEHHHSSRYGYCMLLLLPQLEHMLRNVYCMANSCPERMLTAESTAFYVTLDEILSQHIQENEPNKVRMMIGDNILEMLRDVLVYQEGPRLRDKISHGECDLQAIPKLLSNHVICVALALMYKLKQQKTSTEPLHRILKNNMETGLKGQPHELKEAIIKLSAKYIAVFHPSTLLRRSIAECFKLLHLWKQLPWPSCAHDFHITAWEEIVSEDKMGLKEIKQKLNSLVLSNLELQESDVLEDTNLLLYRIDTLYRPKVENEVLTLLRQIIGNIQAISKQVKETFENRYSLFTSHSLRSRQRETYHRMLTVLPHLHSSAMCIVLIVTLKWMHVNATCSLLPKELQALLKFLRNILQYVQNIRSLTKLEKNRWEEIASLTSRFSQQLPNTIKEIERKSCKER